MRVIGIIIVAVWIVQTIAKQPRIVTLTLGTYATFNACPRTTDKPSVKWLCREPCRDNSATVARTDTGEKDARDPGKDKYMINEDDPGNYSARITFKEVQMTDEGRYRCIIQYEWSHNIEYFQITVQIKTTVDIMAEETGYQDTNTWIDWMIYTADSLKVSGCLACAMARPMLATVPFPIHPREQPELFSCLLALFSNDEDCTQLAMLFPKLTKAGLEVPKPNFTPYPGSYVCFIRYPTSSRKSLGSMMGCNKILAVSAHSKLSKMKYGRTDIWWYCGEKTIYSMLPEDWSGTCTIIQLVLPFRIQNHTVARASTTKLRNKRQVPKGAFDKHVYLDSIGIPRGVPDEFKARNQIMAGIESIFLWPTINKNVDWINYIYYNQQRFVNYTRDAIRGIAEQLDKTSLMTWQNRMALDMLLAEKGGVCKMFGSYCCTFIPNNTAPDGSVLRALEGLESLSIELAEHSGVDTTIFDFLDSWLGKYKVMFLSMCMSIAVMIAILTVCGCCCIPCIRALVGRLIITALSKESNVHGQYLQREEEKELSVQLFKDDNDDDDDV